MSEDQAGGDSDSDDVEQTSPVRARELEAAQHAAVAELGRLALRHSDLQRLFQFAVEQTATLMDGDCCKVLELLPCGTRLRLCAGVGWQPGLVGEATVGADLASQAGYTLAETEPVVVADLRQETRFKGPQLLHDHGIVSGVSVVIYDGKRPWGVLGVHTRKRRDFCQRDVHFLQSIANVLGTSIERRRREDDLQALSDGLEQMVARRTAQVRDLATALSLAEQRERERLSQILHEDLQQRLYALELRVHLLRRQYGADDPELDAALARLEGQTDGAVRLTRKLSLEFNPPVLQHEGLGASLEWLAIHMEDLHDLQVDVEHNVAEEALEADRRVMLVQFVRELLSNVVRHADTDRAEVVADCRDGHIVVSVIDHGCGFSPEEIRHRGSEDRRFGLYAIRERIQLLGGHFSLSSHSGDGTQVTLQLPL